ncbi:hypothetical protein E5226_05115 [Cellulomonas shaoxiangyii]|nr:hypothetical protein E5226_05115 [Cellulomonas shaoxiangyii]
MRDMARQVYWSGRVGIDPGTGLRGIPDATRLGRPVELKPDNPRVIARGVRQLARYERAANKRGELWAYRVSSTGVVSYRRVR